MTNLPIRVGNHNHRSRALQIDPTQFAKANANPSLDICSCGTGKDIAVDRSKTLGATAKAAFPG